MSANVISNVVSYTIAADAKQACDGAVQTLLTYLKPTLLSLNDDDRRSLPRIGAKNEVLMVDALAYARTNPELLPSFISIDEFQRDVDCIQILKPYRQALFQMVEMIDDTMDQARAEGYGAGLALYQCSKTAAKLNQPGAVTVRDGLAACFTYLNRRTTVTTPPPPPAPAPAA